MFGLTEPVLFFKKLIIFWPFDPLVSTLVEFVVLSFVIGLIEVEIGSLGAPVVTGLSCEVFVERPGPTMVPRVFALASDCFNFSASD